VRGLSLPGVAAAQAPQCRLLAACLGLAAFGAFAVAAADGRLANTAREAAGWLAAKYGTPPGRLWFQGHWGFQYYLQEKGARPLDFLASSPTPGDFIVIPSSEAGGYELPPAATTLEEVLALSSNAWLTTMDRTIGAGFHSDFWGPLPFALGVIEPDRYYVFRVVRPFKYASWAPVLDTAGEGSEPEELAKLQATLQANPGDVDARFQSALLRMRQSQLPEAIAALVEVLRLRPDDFRTHVQLGQLYAGLGHARDAKAQYYAALQAMPDSPGVLNNLAWLLATDADSGARNGDEAVRLARRACALTLQKSPLTLGTLAAAYAEAGRFSDAVSTAENARDLATTVNQPSVAERNRQLLEFYRAGKPYHEPEAVRP
jgi:tetratricopeptide (TPR) repeat protein